VVVAVLMTSPISQGAHPIVAFQTGSLHASVVRAELAIANLENSARLTVSVPVGLALIRPKTPMKIQQRSGLELLPGSVPDFGVCTP
jgi:hypothetical protein